MYKPAAGHRILACFPTFRTYAARQKTAKRVKGALDVTWSCMGSERDILWRVKRFLPRKTLWQFGTGQQPLALCFTFEWFPRRASVTVQSIKNCFETEDVVFD